MKADRTIKIIAVVCLSWSVVALITTGSSPAKGYEASIYTVTSPLGWGCFFFSIACGIGSSFIKYTKKKSRAI